MYNSQNGTEMIFYKGCSIDRLDGESLPLDMCTKNRIQILNKPTIHSSYQHYDLIQVCYIGKMK